MDPKIKNYYVIFHTRSATNGFTRKLLTKFAQLHFFTEEKNLFHKNILSLLLLLLLLLLFPTKL